MMVAASDRVPSAARWLAGAGTLPFLAGAIVVATGTGDAVPAAASATAAYGAVILSFLGGIHWGFAAADHGTRRARLLGASVLPALVGWVALLIPQSAGLVVLAAAFAGVFVLDRIAAAENLAPPWWLRLRAPLSLAVTAMLLVTALTFDPGSAPA